MFRYGLTIFFSAFLLFQIQPLIARLILPTFGGTAAVWTTCMMFFQVALLLGYLYSHLLSRWFSPSKAWLLHGGLLLISAVVAGLLFQPDQFGNGSLPGESAIRAGSAASSLTGSILSVLAVSIGLPFFALATTGPLVQAWQSTTHHERSPYRLYALSNAASLLALISYPFLIEPWLSLANQQIVWMVGFLLFCVSCFWAGRQTVGHAKWHQAEGLEAPQTIGSLTRAGWIVLPMTASIVLLATTNLMCQEVASIPFLWILPLTLYLVSFIICFERPQWYRRRPWMLLLGIASVVSIVVYHLDVNAGLVLQVSALSGVCFCSAMVCHGELERSKPNKQDLTAFYLWVAAGGALGGIFVAVIAPQIFDGFYEFHLGLVVSLLFGLAAIYRCLYGHAKDHAGQPLARQTGLNRFATIATGGVLLLGLAATGCSLMYFLDPSYHQGLVFRGRNEYGLTTVVDRDGYRQFINGRVLHGGQNLESNQRLEHNAYYVKGSGVAVAFDGYRALKANAAAGDQQPEGLTVGVLGLGAGAMCTWLQPQDSIVFYEINPMVQDVAREHFSYLSDAPGEKEVLLGDGRVLMQRDTDLCLNRGYDLLFMDAFASDSIPVHLLTEESIQVYLDQLDQDGTIVFHISNHFIDLLPVLLQHARTYDMTPLMIDTGGAERGTIWVMLTRNQNFVDLPGIQSAICPLPEQVELVRWTDDYSSVAAQLNWSATVDWQSVQQAASDVPAKAPKPSVKP